ncbi:peptide chain release factor PrfB3, chloroplastic isoform X2 [Carya illinoinensis]|uniref:peptide chain release factor PrfB3, chloroplastic isoform X2 n=1 Tax=Carya illinoinensis TaxID=32201 RepID=UPI001C725B5E|nr:peptide chain release factor PrfB3, chloroplastic isoform X2 [Carya illinoinensis]
MAKMWAESVCVSKATSSAALGSTWETSSSKLIQPRSEIQYFLYAPIRASHSVDDNNKAYKQLGLSSLKKKIGDAVIRAEMFAPTALEVEEARWSKQEEMIRDSNLWDDPAKSDRILVKLADVAKVVDSLKDLTFKAEEAKLITELADMNGINCGLFRQAYNASLDVSKFLDHYRMSKLLKEPYDLEGACVIINAGSRGIYPKIWAEQLLSMYAKWAKKQGYKGRVVEKCSSKNGGIKSAMIEFESECAYGYLSGERGVHSLIGSQNGYILCEASAVCVDVVPLFLKTTYDLQIDDVDLVVSSSSIEQSGTEQAICIQHIPTGIKVQSSAERSRFANKIKALNRLKAKLLVIAREQGVSSVTSIKRDAIVKLWQKETRKYVSHPYKLVQDVKTGIELSDLDSVLDGNIEPFIEAHINMR